VREGGGVDNFRELGLVALSNSSHQLLLSGRGDAEEKAQMSVLAWPGASGSTWRRGMG
jgi:hypothetical protein